jgi:hypothetical protein
MIAADPTPPAPRRKRKGTSPTQRTLKYLRELGYLVAVVEKWNPHARIRQDLYGFIDVLAVKRDETLAVQCCSGGRAAGDQGEDDKGRGSDVGDHVRKIAEHPNIGRVREANWRIVVHAWRKSATGRWTLREIDVS